MMRVRPRSGTNLGVLLLAVQVLNMGLENIPPCTLALVATQVAIHLHLVPHTFPSAQSVCMSSYLVLKRGDWRRLFLSVFYHADDMHLYFNMASLLWKGRSLERRFGSVYFMWMVAVFTLLSSLGYCCINYLMEDKLQNHSFATQCAVGFSGVLFAMKVVTTHYVTRGHHYALGFIPVPSRHVYWAELLLIQLVTPNASFTGHLAGIMVGLAYTKGPLKRIMDSIILPGQHYSQMDVRRAFRPWYWTIGTASSSARGGYNTNYNPNSAYDEYTGSLSEEEQYQRAMKNSRQESPGLYPDLEKLRQRRAARYQ